MSKKVFIRAFTSSIAVIVLAGCVSSNTTPVTTRNSELTQGNVQLNLKIGITNQTEVLEVFGAPNITSIDGSGNEVWTYQRNATVSQSSEASAGAALGWKILLLGGARTARGGEQTQRTITLIIKFNDKKIVSDFRSRASDF